MQKQIMIKNRRNTVAKTFLIQILKEHKEALSHSDIYDKMAEICDRVTIYRILNRLLEQEEIHKISTAEGEIKYALCKQCNKTNHTHDHAHFTCKICGKTTCLYNVHIQFSLPQKYIYETMNCEINGICSLCNNKH
jgi:Fur family ferric uptake transcriptional regulator